MNLTSQDLFIPIGTLEAGRVYTITALVTKGENSQLFTYTIPVISKVKIQKLEVLNVAASAIKVFPKEGLAGETDFTTQYTFSNIPMFQTGDWSFKIKIEGKSKLVFTKTNHKESFRISGNAE